MSAVDHILVERGRRRSSGSPSTGRQALNALDPLAHRELSAALDRYAADPALARRGDHRRGRARVLRRQRPEGARRHQRGRPSADRLRRHLAPLRSRQARDRRGERARARRRRRDRRGLRSRDRGRSCGVRAARAARRPRGARRRRAAAARAPPAAEIRHGAGAHRPPLRRRGGEAHRPDQRRGAARRAEGARARRWPTRSSRARRSRSRPRSR